MHTLLFAIALIATQDAPASPPAAASEAVALPFEALEISARLARLARERSDPWLLAAAARIRLQTPVAVAGDADETWARMALDWLDEAQAMSDGDEGLRAVIEDLRSGTPKGRAGGATVTLSRLSGGGVERRAERFTPGHTAVVYVEGDGDSPLRLRILSDEGPVCSDDRPGDVKLCVWQAKTPGTYQVEVQNLGRVANRYAYGTN